MPPFVLRVSCAQRLSASEKESRRRSIQPARGRDVLNACRRRRRNHRLGAREFIARLYGAQRLSASEKESRVNGGSSSASCTSAQRLSASEKESQWTCARPLLGDRCSTPVGVGEGITPTGM